MAHHTVKRTEQQVYEPPPEFRQHSSGYSTDSIVSEEVGAVQMGFRLARFEDGARMDAHLHSFEETFYVLEGSVTVDMPEGSFVAHKGDYGLIPVGVTHAIRNHSGTTCRPGRDARPHSQTTQRLRHLLPRAAQGGRAGGDRRPRSP